MSKTQPSKVRLGTSKPRHRSIAKTVVEEDELPDTAYDRVPESVQKCYVRATVAGMLRGSL